MTPNVEPTAPPPEVALLQMIFGKAITQAVSVAARFKVADKLTAGPKTCDQLARETATHAGHLYRVMRALASVGVFAEGGDGRFSLTPMSEFLRTDRPGSLRPVATYVCDPWSWKPWGELAGCVKTGRPAFDKMFGKGVFDYLAEHPDEAATFDEGMTGFSQQASAAVVKAYDFSPFREIVDVGGGHAALLSAILKATPNARGVVFDAPQVVAGAEPTVRAAGLADRCRTAGGDFFKEVPSGGELYLMKNIIHDWNDEKATAILRSCRRAIKPGGKLLLVEIVIEPGSGPSFGKLLDLEMMVLCDGKERTETEYRELLGGAGFRLTRIVPTESPHSLIEAVPA
ncbi:MAG TPA: methyltransferase [Gemmataceae bacterium]|nr:methyltransferase [Gemmataceae bacterium]